MGKKVLTTKNIAAELNLNPRTIARLLLKGLPYVDKGRKLGFEFDVEECKKWYEEYQNQLTQEHYNGKYTNNK